MKSKVASCSAIAVFCAASSYLIFRIYHGPARYGFPRLRDYTSETIYIGEILPLGIIAAAVVVCSFIMKD